jgi:fermentation-respiration switch protein FrsA (DUF1100 family)
MFWVGLTLILTPLVVFVIYAWWQYFAICREYLHIVIRVFLEKPLFVIPQGKQRPEGEEVRFQSSDGLNLCGCYFRTPAGRKGVILFGLEYGSNRWSCWPYTDYLIEAGFDVFAFECRNQGDSDKLAGYDPLQWVTDFEVADTQAALDYLKSRPDADPRGVGFFGVSKGGGAGLFVASRDPYIRCCATDGAFATYSTVVPYMKQWVRIYTDKLTVALFLPSWFYGVIGLAAIRRVEEERGCKFPHLEKAIGNLAPRPLLMMHGEKDTYIRPRMAERVFRRARGPREFWVIPGAKHNQGLEAAPEEYRRRIRVFFEEHLANIGSRE